MKPLNDLTVKVFIAVLLFGIGFAIEQFKNWELTVPTRFAHLQVQELGDNESRRLRLKGWIMSHVGASDGYSLWQEGRTLQVRLRVRFALNASREYDIVVKVPKEINRVTFGNEKTLVWLRDPNRKLGDMHPQ